MKREVPDFGSIDYAVTFGRNLRRIRREINNLSQEELAIRLKAVGMNMDYRTVSKLERGILKKIDLRELEALAYVLDCPIRALWTPSSGVKL